MVAAELWRDLIGLPFVSGGRGPDAYDCYGLLVEIFQRRGMAVAPYSTPASTRASDARLAEFMIATVGAEWRQIKAPIPGCALLFRDAGAARHVGVYLGDDRFIHCTFRLGQVAIERLAAVQSFLPLLGAYEPVLSPSEAPHAV